MSGFASVPELAQGYWSLGQNCLEETDRYGFFGPIPDISKFFKSCFLLHYIMHFVPYLFPKLQKSGFMS